jgi:AraC-like DNA-binding protein
MRAPRASTPRISGRMTARVLTLLERRGHDLAALGLTAPDLRHPEARVDVDTVDWLVERAASVLGASGLGVAIANVADVDTYGAAGRVMLAARTLREAFELGFKHQRLWGDGERFSMVAGASAFRLRFAHPGRSPLARAVLAEVALVEMMYGVKRLAGEDACARGVGFVHRPLGRVEALRGVFGCDVTFGARANEIDLPPALANAPLSVPHDLLRAALEHEAQRAEERLPDRASIVSRVHAVAGDFPSLAQLAARLRLSARTLQRKLAEEGATYFGVIDALREDAVARLLASGLSEKAIALEVGFHDDRALRRARRRWAVSTPTSGDPPAPPSTRRRPRSARPE